MTKFHYVYTDFLNKMSSYIWDQKNQASYNLELRDYQLTNVR